VDTYKEIYQCWHDHGVEMIVHHSDSYAATLVPYMIEMGIDIWQGALPNNDIPSLIKQYGDKITIMGDIDSSKIDVEGWTRELVRDEVRRAMDECGPYSFIPCTTQGAPLSNFEGVLDCAIEEVAAYSKECFGNWKRS